MKTESSNGFRRRARRQTTVATQTDLPLDPQMRGTHTGNGSYKSVKSIPFTGLLTNELLTALSGHEFAMLLPHLEPVSFLMGQDLYEFDDALDFVYFPETAVVSHLYFLQDGSTTAAAIVGKEGMIGLSAILEAPRANYWAEVTLAGTAIRARPEIIKQEFAKGGTMQTILLKYMSSRLAQLSQKAVCNGRHKLEERLCTWLLMIQDRATESTLPLTHEEMAQHLGARRAGITGACNALRDSGIIDYQRGMLRIVERERLEDVACECYRALKDLHVG